MNYTKKEVLDQINKITVSAQKVRSTTGDLSEPIDALLGTPSKRLNSSHIVTLGTKICDADNPPFIDVFNFYTMVNRDQALSAQLIFNEVIPYELEMKDIMTMFGM